MKSLISPHSTREARLLRLGRNISKTSIGVPQGYGELMTWVHSHVRHEADRRLSIEEEKLREPKMLLMMGTNSAATYGEATHGNMFFFREYPMYPGEYIPAQHNALSSMRDELKVDLAAQSLKDSWARVSGGTFFNSEADYYRRVDGLEERQIGEIVSAVLPGFNVHQSTELISRLFETLSKPNITQAKRLQQTITAEAMGLDNAPGHYSNFLDWMARIIDSKAFKTENALFEFTRRHFCRNDVKIMFENYNLMSKNTLAKESADGYSHFYSVMKDLARKSAGEDTRAMIGVRIDKPEYDEETGIAVGYGFSYDRHVIAYIRENRDRTGRQFFMGKLLNVAFDDRCWSMEHVLWAFDEANLDYRDFDVYFMCISPLKPFMGDSSTARACRLSLSNAITHLIPLTRPSLKKAGLLSIDRRQSKGPHPGYLTPGNRDQRVFQKR